MKTSETCFVKSFSVSPQYGVPDLSIKAFVAESTLKMGVVSVAMAVTPLTMFPDQNSPMWPRITVVVTKLDEVG